VVNLVARSGGTLEIPVELAQGIGVIEPQSELKPFSLSGGNRRVSRRGVACDSGLSPHLGLRLAQALRYATVARRVACHPWLRDLDRGCELDRRRCVLTFRLSRHPCVRFDRRGRGRRGDRDALDSPAAEVGLTPTCRPKLPRPLRLFDFVGSTPAPEAVDRRVRFQERIRGDRGEIFRHASPRTRGQDVDSAFDRQESRG
jgi:hypothetical protein